jgi:riboflavin kinase/FMN adenylyltransferase
VRINVDNRLYDGVANFGRRPMFDSGVVPLEVFLFDFAGDLYGNRIDVAFIAWIREEEKFGSLDELVRAIDADSRNAREALSRASAAFPPIREG